MEKREALAKAPNGKLLVKYPRKSKRPQYYCRTKKEKTGTYIKRKNIDFAAQLAQKDYDNQILKSAEEELQLLLNLQNHTQNFGMENIACQMNEGKRELIREDFQPLDDYIKEWQSVEFTPKGFASKELEEEDDELYSDRGERMRSKSELLIANKLNLFQIPYRYEYPLELDVGEVLYPDFMVLNRRTGQMYLWEHFGMMSDESYINTTIRKIKNYGRSNIFVGKQLILTFENEFMTLSTLELERIIKEYLL